MRESEARWKAEEREATKEQMQKEKQERDMQVAACKEAHLAKRAEEDYLQAERQDHNVGHTRCHHSPSPPTQAGWPLL